MDIVKNENKTLRSVVKYGEAVLTEHGIDNAAYDSFALFAELLDIDRTYYFVHQNDSFQNMDIYQKYIENIEKRANHIPLQHILGYTEFFGRRFIVDENVLVPRADTECLIEESLKYVHSGSRVLDMCTGSGCILLTLALERKITRGIGVDVSEAALQVAKKNCELLDAENLTFVQSDIFNELADERFDVIVSNPPYISTAEIEKLDDEVKVHDPMLALDGHEDGLYFYRKITSGAAEKLLPGGWLIYEIGYDQSQAVEEMLQKHGYEQIKTVKDLAGLDRVVLGKLK